MLIPTPIFLRYFSDISPISWLVLVKKEEEEHCREKGKRQNKSWQRQPHVATPNPKEEENVPLPPLLMHDLNPNPVLLAQLLADLIAYDVHF